jgi:hypothetical protein
MKVDTEEFIDRLMITKEQIMYDLVKGTEADDKSQDRLIGKLEAVLDIIEWLKNND